MTTRRSEKHGQTREALPVELRPVFDQLVEDYQFAATIHHGSPFVSYATLAEMVMAGWRPSGEPLGQWKAARDSTKASDGEDESE